MKEDIAAVWVESAHQPVAFGCQPAQLLAGHLAGRELSARGGHGPELLEQAETAGSGRWRVLYRLEEMP